MLENEDFDVEGVSLKMKGRIVKTLVACAPFAAALAAGCSMQPSGVEVEAASAAASPVEQKEVDRFRGVWQAVDERSEAVETTLYSELGIMGAGRFSLEVKRVVVLNARDVLEEHLLHVSGVIEEIAAVKQGSAMRLKALSKDLEGMEFVFTAVEKGAEDGSVYLKLEYAGSTEAGASESASWIKSLLDESEFRRL